MGSACCHAERVSAEILIEETPETARSLQTPALSSPSSKLADITDNDEAASVQESTEDGPSTAVHTSQSKMGVPSIDSNNTQSPALGFASPKPAVPDDSPRQDEVSFSSAINQEHVYVSSPQELDQSGSLEQRSIKSPDLGPTAAARVEEFTLPESCGHGIYLLVTEKDNGSLYIQYTETAEALPDMRPIAYGRLEKKVQKFKYLSRKLPTKAHIFDVRENCWPGVVAYIRACGQNKTPVEVFPLPPKFPDFAIVYLHRDNQLTVQRPGDGSSVTVDDDIMCVAVCAPQQLENIKRVQRLEYNQFKIMFSRNRQHSAIGDLARR